MAIMGLLDTATPPKRETSEASELMPGASRTRAVEQEPAPCLTALGVTQGDL
jgi:hypothetical protein